MGKGSVPGAARGGLAIFCVIALVLLSAARQAHGDDAAATMQAYCSVPPLPGFGVKPNLLLLLDNSASMYDLAYTDPNTFCLDDSFDATDAGNYPGYFDQGTVYRYSPQNGGGFVAASGTSIEASSCNQARTSYFCVNVDGSKKLNNFLATGKFLNWLAMSKLDLEKLALTGGKYHPATGMLQAESRGCQGKRYVKIVNGGDGNPLPVTFGVRGPIPSESGYVSQGNHGGPTRIDIYPARYNRDACLSAVRKWQQRATVPDLGDAVGLCMGALYDDIGVPTPGKLYTEALSYCYSHLAGVQIRFGDLEPTLLTDCLQRYAAVYDDQPTKLVKNTGDDICARDLYHNLLYHGPVANTRGYLGQCYNGHVFVPQCVEMQMLDFCSEVERPWLSDPSVNASQSGTDASLPAFILEAGIYNLGVVAATAQVRLAPPAAPAGLIQQYAADINFGAMIFNDNGAGSECGGVIPCLKHCQNDAAPRRECYADGDCSAGTGPCIEDTRNDGARIISYINYSPVGDHASGLVAAVDAIRGTSWTPLAEALYETIGYFAGKPAFRFQADDFDTAHPPSGYSCQRNNVLILTDGMSTADRAPAVNGFVAAAVASWVNGSDGMPASRTTAGSTAAGAAPENLGSYNLDDLAWIARHKNIFDPTQPIARQKDYITTHVVYTGPPCGDPKSTATPKTGYNPDGSCVTSDEGKPEKMMQLTAANGGGSIRSVHDPAGLQDALKGVLQQVIGGSNTGASSSILATGEGNGALFLQPQFYPNKSFDAGSSSAAWIGELQSLWYYIDPFIGGSSGGASSIREDTGGDKILDLKRDRVVQFSVEPLLGEARASLYRDEDGDGSIDLPQPAGYPQTVVPEAVQSLWRAGRQLWERPAGSRTIYTQTGGASLVPFLDTSVAANRQLLLARDQAEADQIVAFVKGTDDSAGNNGAPTRARSVTAYGNSDRKVWKLGDIISSAPVLQSAVPLGSYHLPVPRGYGDPSYAKFVDSKGVYPNRGTVYVGANDGMLHAFRLGRLTVRPDGAEGWPASQKALLLGSGVGEEEWAFVPKNALPYLRYLKEPLYPHLYYVDGVSTLVDASLGDPERCSRDDYWNCARDTAAGSNWRTILVGGMGLGGASRSPDGASCVDQGDSATCVKAPAAGVGGLSSYFALDVTEQTSNGTGTPRFLWEFSHPELGFATSGAAILRIKARTLDGQNLIHDPDKNGRWFAVFASGPTGAVDRKTRQFTAVSDQNLKLFVVDLNALPPLSQGRNYWVIDTGIAKAFGGSMAGAGIDADRWNGSSDMRRLGNYEDDALYVGYTRPAEGGGWTGGVLRLFTNQDPDPSKWKASKVIDGVGPVTGSIGKLQDRQYKRLWLYFGTGRYFNNQDDLGSGRALYGVSEPCYGGDNTLRDDGTCSASPVSLSDLTNVTDPSKVVLPEAQNASYRGWWIALDAASGNLGSERTIDSPTSLTGGAVFFATYKPPLDPCLEGVSYLWGVQYNTGGSFPSLTVKALVPLSNGSSAAPDGSSFTERGNRRSAAMTGKAAKPRLISNSGLKPLKKIIHIQER